MNTLSTEIDRLEKALPKNPYMANIQKLESELIDEVRDYGVKNGNETIRIINKNGQLSSLQSIKENPSLSQLLKSSWIEIFLKLHCSTLIHNHLLEHPLSPVDIVMSLEFELKKVIATTPSGGYSALHLPEKPEDIIKMKRQTITLIEAEILFLKDLGIEVDDDEMLYKARCNTPPDKRKAIGIWRLDEIQKLVEEFGLKFDYQLDY